MSNRPVPFIGLCALLFVVVLPLSAVQNTTLPPDTVQALVAEANDLATVQFRNADALARYQAAEKLDPKNYAALWGISRCYVDIGEHLPSKTDEEKQVQLDHYQKSLDYANRAIEANSQGSMGYLRRAIANGRVALFKGVWESLDLVKSVKADAEKAIALDPSNATAYYILGRTHAKVSERPGIVRWPLGLSWASYEDAVKYYEEALTLRPDFIMYRLDAARAYVELDEYETARMHLAAIPSISNQDEDDDQYRKEASALAEEIRNE